MIETGTTIEQEIAQLEQQLAEKRVSLEQDSSVTGQEDPGEKETLKQMIGEKIQRHIPAYQPAQPVPAPTTTKKSVDDLSYNDPQLADKVQEFVNVAFNKGLDDAIKSVDKSGNPALIDAFHDVLVDRLYDILLERKKLEEVK
ncbi:MAG: hypothetical protein COV30_02495 [Candidatus Yanofskybacteria bacterium CG10_big_fil_rev_8_21_14_0_10_37_15]|uniref:Uncharacterized protein n=1 Tax=Candidatus Yanofskybacteria bacterium CG10_big_fil_rev_8_21_14_0_10_37_15 TaxID=1975097 RepID=A0A2H0R585_9BACT|nr:MAG: hypothetical protein COV30_02495 [Candidatus Yanofskybacteria bacterium CG10_big_fil_rev_8_21_14_0_10_37_15]